ncbi:tripartite tricarboxylate transporter permease [Marinobacter sp. M3C]|jgi:putative tricarboxylic transport membrane protein|uniref:tripartite tricarboxylate transporter permease n=1 Tax=Marinobacter sp. M3C TaxID=2917715 RepID=UPI00200CC3A7|nr:tripartite tricarboxylate transporter permease [Marinobacter sp. M3C]MCL1482461.1 tripartite tricarboxylate transporter permease [Marinobacter sp.]MCL1488615.1 tripartite tricarboxylate transporter permease [Marinobacter sp.]UQG60098.1 tripartite tricarboxylate transporter permease [Marinobacter sp. M3C]
MTELLGGLLAVITLESMSAMLMGTAAGILVGAIPGLTATLAMALLLPFTYAMDPFISLGMMAGIYNGSMFGGAIPAILMKIPGTPSAVATVFDGNPLAASGRAKFAIHVALCSSSAGSVISAIALMLLAPPLVELALKFGPVEYFWIAIFGMTSVSLLLASAPAKGLASALIGIAVGIVGMDMISGAERLVFDVRSVAGGINIAVLLTGLFAIPPALAMLDAHSRKLGDVAISGQGITIKDALYLVKTWLRSGLIGVFVGVMPGAGGNLAGILSYAEEKRAAKDSSLFGKGDPRGVAASECGNNADNASSLIPTLALGVPGNSVAALMMGAMLIQGLNPGPALFTQSGDVVYGFMWQMLITAFLMLAIGFVGTGLFVRMLKVPTGLLAPMILVVCSIGTYTASNNIADVWIMLVVGVCAFLLSRSGYPIAPIVLGAILGPMAETSFRQSVLISRGDPLAFFASPISIVLVTLIAAVLLFPLWRWFRQSRA